MLSEYRVHLAIGRAACYNIAWNTMGSAGIPADPYSKSKYPLIGGGRCVSEVTRALLTVWYADRFPAVTGEIYLQRTSDHD